MLLIPFFKRPSIPIFGNSNSRPFETRPFHLQDLVPDTKAKGFMDEFIKDSNRKKPH